MLTVEKEAYPEDISLNSALSESDLFSRDGVSAPNAGDAAEQAPSSGAVLRSEVFAYGRQVRKQREELTAEQKQFKRDTLQAMMDYRKAAGLGSMTRLSDACGLSVDTLRGMMEGSPYEFSCWEKLSAGLPRAVAACEEEKQKAERAAAAAERRRARKAERLAAAAAKSGGLSRSKPRSEENADGSCRQRYSGGFPSW